MIDSLPIVWAVFNLSDFARYPLSIYHKGIGLFLTWLIPYGFTAFYPAAYFIGGEAYKWFAVWTPVTAVTACGVSYAFWNFGLKSFSSTGS